MVTVPAAYEVIDAFVEMVALEAMTVRVCEETGELVVIAALVSPLGLLASLK